ncbi:acyl-homoserine-lactone synthase [Methylobacterium tarhaniae]|uniref:acyl-homoserine-lactone synthase n=1 Tax=Methylobacterium tarhaniae TaxID=1187852 RepID=UPI003D0825E4
MIRLHVIDRTNRGAFADALAQHHALRRAACEEAGCRALQAIDASGHDRFDTETTRYLLAIGGDGQVAGGTRLLPSEGPTLLSEIFPHLADIRGVEREPGTWECTRFFAAPRFREDRLLSRPAGIVAAGLIEHCLEQGIPRLNLVVETYWIPQMAEIGWRPRPLGLPAADAGVSLCAVTVAMTEEALQETRAAYGIVASVLARPEPRPPTPQNRARPGRGLAA